MSGPGHVIFPWSIMKILARIIWIVVILILTACNNASCPEGTVTYLTPPYPLENRDAANQSQLVEIKGKEVLVDRVITGPVCNDTWER